MIDITNEKKANRKYLVKYGWVLRTKDLDAIYTKIEFRNEK